MPMRALRPLALVLLFSTLCWAEPDAPNVALAGSVSPVAVEPDFDCSQIEALGLDRQANLRAALLRIRCGQGIGGTLVPTPPVVGPDYGGADVNTITGTETLNSVTQSESMVWGNGNTIVVTYNDSRTAPSNYSGGSYSTDGGTTFTRLNPSPFASGHGTNYGDPNTVYNASLATWYSVFLATGCGGQGLGVWTSTDGVSWATGACAHNGGSDDRNSMWVDNNPGSPYYGRMYISYNNFAVGGGALYCLYSDNGTSWTNVSVVGSFIRNVQLTGSPGTDGTVFLATMNEGGGGGANRQNTMYRSTNGGVSWTSSTMGASFPPPGSGPCAGNSYFYMIPPIWRHQGWGQPGVGPGSVVHYAYCGHGSGADIADVLYTRSTDNGITWSAAIKLNTDTTTQAQWMPSLAVTAAGGVVVSWYDRRNTTNGTNYEYWSRISPDNGQTWLADQPTSDVLITQPLQPDPNVQSCYAGDYNYHSTLGSTALVTWTDGRVAVSGTNQQDVFFDKISLISCPTITLSPATLPNGTVGSAYSQTISASGGTAPYTYAVTAGALPPGLTLSTAGALTGTPTVPATYNFTVTATDNNGCTGSLAYQLVIDTCPSIIVSPATLPSGTFGSPYAQTLTASGGTAPYAFAISAGALPSGLSLSSGGVLSGTPAAVGVFGFTVTATDAGGCAGSTSYQLRISCAAIAIAPSTVPGGTLGVPYSQTLSASGGQSPYTFAMTAGSLPPGITLSSAGLLSGTPTGSGSFSFTVTATDALGCTASAPFTIGVASLVDYLVGQGLGDPNPNQVKVYDRAAAPTSVDFLAYAAGHWGANVASGDVDGGRYAEILTGPGPGDVFGPQVRGFQRDGTSMGKINFYAYGTLRYGVNVASGDIDGDGYGEILSGAGPGQVFGPHVRGWNFDGAALTAMAKVGYFAYNTLRYGVNVAATGVDADGYDELLTTPGPGAMFGPQVKGWNYDATTVTNLSGINFNAFAAPQYGANVAGGDVDADGFGEIVATPGPGPSAITFPARFRGYDFDGGPLSALPGYDATPFATSYGGRVGLGDVTSDGDDELMAAPGRDPAASARVKPFHYDGASLTAVAPGVFTAFATGSYGVNVAGGALGY